MTHNEQPKRVIGRPFEPGNTKGLGRPKGSRNKLGEAFVGALLTDFEANGVAAIEKVRADDPSTYVRVIAGLLPKEVTGENGEPLFTGITVSFVKPGECPKP